MRPSNRVLSVLSIHAEEGRIVSFVLCFGLFLFAGNVFINTAAYAIFLDRFGGQSLPYIYIGSSIISMLVSYVYIRLYKRVPLAAVIRWTLIGLVVATILLWSGLSLTDSEPRWLVFVLPMYASLLAILSTTLFANLLNRLFTLQQGKRLFGLLGSGEQFAVLIAGIFSTTLVALLGTPNLLIVGAVSHIGASLALVPIIRQYRRLLSDVEEGEPAREEKPQGRAGRGRYLNFIIGLFLFYVLSYYIVDNIFYTEVETRFIGEDQVASALGLFFGVLGGLSLALQLFVSGRVLMRFGIRPILLAGPTLLALFMIPYAFLGEGAGESSLTFWLAVGAYLVLLIMDAVDSPAISLLFQTFPAAGRVRVQTLVYGVFDPLVAGLAGVSLLLLFQVLDAGTTEAAYILVFLMVGWLAHAYLLGREYPHQVQRALRQRLFGRSDSLQPDRSSLELIHKALNHSQPGAVLYALGLIEQFDSDEVWLVSARLLDHPSQNVRLGTIDTIERQHLQAMIPALMIRRTNEPSPAVQGRLIRAIAALGGAEILDEVAPSLDAPEADVRTGALTGLLRSGDMECMVFAFDRLQSWIQSADPAARLMAVRAIDAAEMPALYRPIARLMTDEELDVRVASLHAAGHLKHPRLWPAVTMRMTEMGERKAALGALVAGGSTALPAIREALAIPFHQEPSYRKRILNLLQALGRIGTPEAIVNLLPYADHSDPTIRAQAIRSLRRAGYHSDNGRQVQAWIELDMSRAAALLQTKSDIRAISPSSAEAIVALNLLDEALDASLDKIQYNLFSLLSFAYDSPLIKRIEDNWRNTGNDRASREGRDFALELIDMRINPPVRTWMKSLLARNHSLAAAGTQFSQENLPPSERLQWLVNGQEWIHSWPRACALYLLCTLRDHQAVRCIQVAASSSDHLVREMGIWADGLLQSSVQSWPSPPKVEALPRNGSRSLGPQLAGGNRPMLTTIERVIALKGVELLADTPDEVLADLVGLLKEVDVPAGDRALTKGDPGSSLFIVAVGSLRIHDGEMDIDRLGEGDVFGELALLDPAPRSATITALTDTILLELERDVFFELLEDRIDVTRRVMRLLARRLRNVTERAFSSQEST